MKDYTTWRRVMKSIIRAVETCLKHFKLSSPRIVRSPSSARTRTHSHDLLRATRSLSQTELKKLITLRLSTRYSKNTKVTYTTSYLLAVTWKDGETEVYSYGTLSQAVKQIEALVTTGMNGLTLHVKSSPSFPIWGGSFLLFSDRWPDVISKTSTYLRTQSSSRLIRPRGAPSTVEIHSSGRAYSRPSTTR